MKKKIVSAILGGLMCVSMLAACQTQTPPAHTHDFSGGWEFDETRHYKECSCGEESESADHTAGEWIIDTAATETATGSKHKECTVCKYVTEREDIPVIPAHEHTWAQTLTADGTGHWYACTVDGCAEKKDFGAHTEFMYTHNEGGATHKKSCKVCAYEVAATENCTAVGEWQMDEENNKHYKLCVCGERVGEAAHSAEWTVTDDKHSKTCECGKVLVAEVDHGAEWTVTDDKHSKTCECGKVLVAEADHGAEWTVTDDKHSKTCECGKVLVAEADHNYNKEVAEQEYFVSPATTASPALYHKSCECGKAGTETFEYGQKLEEGHTHDYTVVRHDGDNHWNECLCGEKDLTSVEAHKEFTYTTNNDGTHKKVCGVCGNEAAEDCSYGAWEEVQAATPDKDGSRKHTCEHCGYAQTEAIPMTAEKGFANNFYNVGLAGDCAATGTDTADGYQIDITKTDGTDWHIKFERSFGTVPGKAYELTYVFSSTVGGNEKVKIEMGSFSAVISGGGYENIVTDGDNTVTGRFVAARDLTYTDLQLGRLDVGQVVIKSVTLKEIAIPQSTEIAKLTNGNTDADVPFTELTGDGTASVTATMKEESKANNWDARVKLTTGFQIEKGKKYVVMLNISGLADLAEGSRPEVALRQGNGWNQDFARVNTGMIGNGMFALTVTGHETTDYELCIWYEMGRMPQGESFTVSDVKVFAVPDSFEIVSTVLHTIPAAPASESTETPAPEAVLNDEQ